MEPEPSSIRSDPPTHPQLLDYLAWRFREGGFSLKNLHRLIMLSAAYRQSSADIPECRAVEGPVPRWGARGNATSIYFHDPEGNEIEARYYNE